LHNKVGDNVCQSHLQNPGLSSRSGQNFASCKNELKIVRERNEQQEHTNNVLQFLEKHKLPPLSSSNTSSHPKPRAN
jgi:hypothetical protein